MSARPKPWMDTPPKGFHFEVVEDKDWRLGGRGHQCRMLGKGRARCKNAAVAELDRGFTRRAWWAYCADHMYGRWIEDGKVVGWVLRPNETEPA